MKLLAQAADAVSFGGSTIAMGSISMSLAEPDSFISSNAPTSFFRQHHEVEAPEVSERAFRPAWRVRTRLDRLLFEGAITPWEFRIAAWLRRCHERGYGSELQSPMTRLGMAGHSSWRGRENPADRRASARQYLAFVEKAMGPIVYGIVVAVVVDDLPWRELGRRCNCHASTARSWGVEAIKVLATV
jgi:hypothetical protein